VVATRPYSKKEDVAFLLQNVFYNGLPSASTIPSEGIVNQLIAWVDALIDEVLRSAGYIVPLEEHPSFGWNETQTTLINYLSALGVASMISGYIFSPVPTRGMPREGGENNPFAVIFERMRSQLLKGEIFLYAKAVPGSVADRAMSERAVPVLEHRDALFRTFYEYSDNRYNGQCE